MELTGFRREGFRILRELPRPLCDFNSSAPVLDFMVSWDVPEDISPKELGRQMTSVTNSWTLPPIATVSKRWLRNSVICLPNWDVSAGIHLFCAVSSLALKFSCLHNSWLWDMRNTPFLFHSNWAQKHILSVVDTLLRDTLCVDTCICVAHVIAK